MFTKSSDKVAVGVEGQSRHGEHACFKPFLSWFRRRNRTHVVTHCLLCYSFFIGCLGTYIHLPTLKITRLLSSLLA